MVFHTHLLCTVMVCSPMSHAPTQYWGATIRVVPALFRERATGWDKLLEVLLRGGQHDSAETPHLHRATNSRSEAVESACQLAQRTRIETQNMDLRPRQSELSCSRARICLARQLVGVDSSAKVFRREKRV